MLRRSGGDDSTFMDSKKKDAPAWNVMSDDDGKLILFREMEKTINKKEMEEKITELVKVFKQVK